VFGYAASNVARLAMALGFRCGGLKEFRELAQARPQCHLLHLSTQVSDVFGDFVWPRRTWSSPLLSSSRALAAYVALTPGDLADVPAGPANRVLLRSSRGRPKNPFTGF
jgi:hypothetical protein